MKIEIGEEKKKCFEAIENKTLKNYTFELKTTLNIVIYYFINLSYLARVGTTQSRID
jgi:hypothetical protein